MRWDFATAFVEKESESAAGVATGSIARPSKVEFRRAPVNEFITHTPKMTLITRYPLAGTRDGRHELLVANIHGINFRGEGPFKRQLGDLMKSLKYLKPLQLPKNSMKNGMSIWQPISKPVAFSSGKKRLLGAAVTVVIFMKATRHRKNVRHVRTHRPILNC